MLHSRNHEKPEMIVDIEVGIPCRPGKYIAVPLDLYDDGYIRPRYFHALSNRGV